MKQKAIMVIALLALVSLMITPVMAETLTGTLGGYNFISTNFTLGYGGTSQTNYVDKVYFKDIEQSSNFNTVIIYPGVILSTDVNATPGNTVPFTAYLLNQGDSAGVHTESFSRGSGTLGYQKIYNTDIPAVEQTTGFIYAVFSSLNVSGLSGGKYIELNYTHSDLYNLTLSKMVAVSNVPSGSVAFVSGGNAVTGYYLNSKLDTASGVYTVIKPAGLNIQGGVIKTGNSRVFIQNSLGADIATESTSNSLPFNFTVVDSQIYVKLLTATTWYNSSLLFSAGAPTPTVTPTPAPTIPPGYVQSIFITIDGMTGYDIHGTNIMLLDVEAGTWTNSTSDADGSLAINTLPYHTINAYATYTAEAGVYSNGELLGVTAPYAGTSHNYIVMYPPALPPGTGNTNLYITARDSVSYYLLTSVTIKYTQPSGAVTVGNTGTSGTDVQVFPNNTVIIVAASKAGYTGASITVNTGTGTTKSATIYLSKATVTPTVTGTILPGETTVRPTQDENDPALHGGDTSFKAQEMMNWIAMNGMSLVQLCFLVTIFALLGVKLGKR